MAFDIAEITRRIRALGSEISPQSIEGTAALYAPYQEREPYAAVNVARDVAYGSNERHRLDVFQATAPVNRAVPMLLFVHGGGFVGGDKRTPGSPYNDNVALWAVRRGLVGINMTYRLAPQHPWPAGAQDVAAAVGFLRKNAERYGGDARRIVLIGTSAGAVHCASYVAHPEFHVAERAGIAGAVLLSGIYDIEAAPRNPFQAAYFGSDERQYGRASTIEGMIASQVPLMFVLTEMDPSEFHAQTLLLLYAWLARHGRLPYFFHMMGHNHLSSSMHLNSPDGSLGERLLDFIGSAPASA
jgi:triacylglycerol lipase